MKKTPIVIALCILLISPVYAAEVNVLMLNKHEKKRNVYLDSIVYIDKGDTVNWIAKSKGHNVEFIMKNGVPDGVDKFKSRLSKKAQYTFTVPGIYAYWCTPHKAMGMVGFVVVGNNKSNLTSIKKVKFRGKSKRIAERLIKVIEEH
tara:strand:- start:756 stop:1196 length:441 start_codon:yes stop_codon:yes gene_type:complete